MHGAHLEYQQMLWSSALVTWSVESSSLQVSLTRQVIFVETLHLSEPRILGQWESRRALTPLESSSTCYDFGTRIAPVQLATTCWIRGCLNRCRRVRSFSLIQYFSHCPYRLVECSQCVTQKILKRSLGNRAWSRNEILAEIKRIAADLNTYLHAHVVHPLTLRLIYLFIRLQLCQNVRYHALICILYLFPIQVHSKHFCRTNTQTLATLSTSVEDIMVKVRFHAYNFFPHPTPTLS
jgi:hypothetical protein